MGRSYEDCRAEIDILIETAEEKGEHYVELPIAVLKAVLANGIFTVPEAANFFAAAIFAKRDEKAAAK